MRHRKSGRHFNRTSAHRKAMFANMASSLIEHEVIQTTAVKAKELRRKIEPLITLAKVDSVSNRRLAFARLRSKPAVGKLFTDLGPRYKTRPGGYTRILKAGYRHGDATMVAYVELIDRPRADYEEDDFEENTTSASSDTATTNETVDESIEPATTQSNVESGEESAEQTESSAGETEVDDGESVESTESTESTQQGQTKTKES